MSNFDENKYNFSILSEKHVTITEIFDEQSTMPTEIKKYFVQEPVDQFDYIFEPDHFENKKEKEAAEAAQKQENNKFTHARCISENDGVLQYKYQSYTYVSKNSNIDQEEEEEEEEDREIEDLMRLNYFDILCANHLDAIIRGVSLSKWPDVGYGFGLGRQEINSEVIYYISDIISNSPAEFSLQLGDVLLELDDIILCGTQEVDDLMKYINEKEAGYLHLMVMHESKYFQLKTNESNDLLKDCSRHCEDIVIVSCIENKKSSQ
jgi:hypothetical protein